MDDTFRKRKIDSAGKKMFMGTDADAKKDAGWPLHMV